MPEDGVFAFLPRDVLQDHFSFFGILSYYFLSILLNGSEKLGIVPVGLVRSLNKFCNNGIPKGLQELPGVGIISVITVHLIPGYDMIGKEAFVKNDIAAFPYTTAQGSNSVVYLSPDRSDSGIDNDIEMVHRFDGLTDIAAFESTFIGNALIRCF